MLLTVASFHNKIISLSMLVTANHIKFNNYPEIIKQIKFYLDKANVIELFHNSDKIEINDILNKLESDINNVILKG